MQCEFCNNEMSVKYGSGRFCNKKCASAFSTKAKRNEINEKVKVSIEIKKQNGFNFKNYDTEARSLKRKATMLEKYGSLWVDPDFENTVKRQKEKRLEQEKLKPFETLSKNRRRQILLDECNRTCTWCNNSTWLGKPINLEIDHIDGNKMNNSKNNLRVLCLNCHSFTPTYRNLKRENLNGLVDDQKQQNGLLQKQ